MYLSARTRNLEQSGGTGCSNIDGDCTLSNLSRSAGADVSFINLAGACNGMFFLRAWRQGTWIYWVGLGLCVICGLYTHIYFSFSLLGLNLWATYETYQQRRIYYRRWVGLLVVQGLSVLAFLPFIPQLFGTVGSVVQWYWIAGTTAFDWVFALLSISNNATLAQESGMPVWYLAATYTAGVTAVMLTLVYSLREARREPAERSGWIFLHLLLWTPYSCCDGDFADPQTNFARPFTHWCICAALSFDGLALCTLLAGKSSTTCCSILYC